MNAFIGLSQSCARVARLPGHIISFKPQSLGVKLELHEFSCALERGHSSMQKKLGSEINAGEPEPGDDDCE
jgi:hypothetical protein